MKKFKDYEEFTDWAATGYSYDELNSDPRKLSFEMVYNILGLAGESGEVVEKIKKAIRNSNIETFSDYFNCEPARTQLLKELGDTLYYLTRVTNLLGSSLEEVTLINQMKLEDRHRRNVVKGEGDER